MVAYSGGVDSHVLLHLLATHQEDLTLRGLLLQALHIDHGLNSESASWQHHCATVCQRLKVEFSAANVNARPCRKESPEAAARRARYDAFIDHLETDDLLLTAQHQDDQAETLLLQLLRGAGPKGLAAMPRLRALGKGMLLRPFLHINQQKILHYAELHDLNWLDDPSNDEQRFDRNYLRQEILPRLQQRWPAVVANLTRSAELCAEQIKINESIVDDDITDIIDSSQRIAIKSLLKLPLARQQGVLRHWLAHLNLPIPSRAKLNQIHNEVIRAAANRQPLLRWPGCEIRRYQGCLYALPPLAPHQANQRIPWSGTSILEIPGIGSLRLRQNPSLGIDSKFLQNLTIRFRNQSARFHPYGRRHSQTLKKLLQAATIPPWQRDRLPLLYSNDRLLAVADLWLAADCVVRNNPDTVGVVIEWQKSLHSINM